MPAAASGVRMSRCSVLLLGERVLFVVEEEERLVLAVTDREPIGPPTLNPGWYCCSLSFGALPVAGSGGRSRLLNQVFAFSPSWRRYW